MEQSGSNKKYFFTKQETLIDILELFAFYNQYFFAGLLQKSVIKWSTRMTLCAGTCKYQGFGSCTITLSQPLLKYRSSNQLKETILHQMIHSYLFITNPQSCKVDGGHGKQFQQIMKNINSITSLNITIYHNFGDQVQNCRKHVWRCNGKCKDLPPYFGYVRRAMNRMPQKADPWFSKHQKQCGGQFIKLSQPQSKQSKSRSRSNSNQNSKSKRKKTQKKNKIQKGKTIEEYIKQYEKQQKKQKSRK